uniref:NHv1.2 protein n=1 Tax=Campoletis sonorensis ichnovirus TaxID=10484 RepID=Q6PW82_CSIV|nr:NHv1.2 protein [Ichnoviriform sonorense]
MSKTENNNAGASVKPVAIPKKRRYLDTVAESNSAREKSTSGTRSILTIKNPVEEVNHEESGNKPKDATKRSGKTVTWATDTLPVKKGRQHAKKSRRKADFIDKPPLEKRHRDVKKQPKIISAPPSTSVVTDKKFDCVNVLPLSDGPPTNKVPSKKTTEKNRFWAHTLASDFDSPDYEMLLKKCHFTEEQTEAIKRSFHLLCRKLHIASTYTNRFMKTHMCIYCPFSISHECVSVHFSQCVRSNANVAGMTTITPESMNMCICGFGFFHSHATNSRIQLSDNLSSMKISRLFEHDRSINLSCPNCHMNIVMKNRNNNVCCDLTNWDDSNGDLNIQFHDFLKDRLELSSMREPNINEFYICRRRCCHIFHRCPENTVPYNVKVTRISPVSTYTRTLVTRSND